MKILFIHNDYRNPSGEEHSADKLVNLLREYGHTVEWYRRSSKGIEGSIIKRIKAFFYGIYNPFAVWNVKKLLKEFKPDIVQIQNLYPFISPAIIKTIKKEGVPIVMRCPNYRLFCPSGLHLDGKSKICEKCLGNGRELNGILKNCENDVVKSFGYSIRNFTARKIYKIHKVIDVFIVQSEFQKNKFMSNGIPNNKIVVIPGFTIEALNNNRLELGRYVTFVGRISKEKGIEDFLKAAKLLPHIPFKVAGKLDAVGLSYKERSPENVDWTGFLQEKSLDLLYKESKIIVVPGKWFEGFPNVIVSAMINRKAIITSNLGAMTSIIEHKENGLLVDPFDLSDLVDSIESLYANPLLCMKYGIMAEKKAKLFYISEKVYEQLIVVYKNLKDS